MIKALKEHIKEFLKDDSSGHGYWHALRVFNLVTTIQENEGGDLESLQIAALLHDVMRPWEKQTGKSHYSEEALNEIIKDFGELIPDSKQETIIDLIRKHDIFDRTGTIEKSLELQILQDADRDWMQ